MVLSGILFTINSAFATVGGPTYIYNFKYNPLNESVYYIAQDQGGRGCPPELFKLSLNTGKSQVDYSCDQGEKLEVQDTFSAVDAEINKITNSFKYLIPINLKTNRISVDVSFVDYEKLSPELDEVKNANFIASVYQDNKKIIDLPIKGCNLEQPFVFGGYTIPGFDKKIVLLLSTKGDCFEGGYINETLHVVGGVSNLDKTQLTNFYKDPEALVPNEGTLVVFEPEEVSKKLEKVNDSSDVVVNKDTDDTTGNEKQADNNILYLFLTFFLALGVGYALGNKTAR